MIVSVILTALIQHYDTPVGIGKWLPRSERQTRQHSPAARLRKADRFVVDGKEVSPYWGTNAIDGTLFVYGDDTPAKGYAVYDAQHRRALYEEGCCAWHEIVAASDVAVPPVKLVSRDLADVRTVHGARLGMTLPQLQQIYGAASPEPVSGRAGISVLQYEFRRSHASRSYAPCEQLESLYFRGGRLFEIDLADAC